MKAEIKTQIEVSGGPVLRDHEYDGIQEYDQKLPNWWLFTFYFAVVWFILYWFLYYQAGMFLSDHEEVTSEIRRIQEVKAVELEAMLSKLDDKVLWDWSRNSKIASEGKLTYDKYCFACHAPDLSATLGGTKLPGLPLNDKEWKYGNNPMTLFRVVSKGSPDKTQAVQMPP
ncbi:MAG TPA: cbb3-type cytochrome c oxidase N-terminal domain-containing protein, partial [Verrucomicrobiales bacterium]|nr:cbb3-type cytochrome c oxidase N-terminal domain-containing protein [Verrucomicrobiales bacterium]